MLIMHTTHTRGTKSIIKAFCLLLYPIYSHEVDAAIVTLNTELNQCAFFHVWIVQITNHHVYWLSAYINSLKQISWQTILVFSLAKAEQYFVWVVGGNGA